VGIAWSVEKTRITTLGSQIGSHIKTAQTLHNRLSKSIVLLENETGSRPWIARPPPDTLDIL
jgi:hypothetical protein